MGLIRNERSVCILFYLLLYFVSVVLNRTVCAKFLHEIKYIEYVLMCHFLHIPMGVDA